MPVVAVLRRDDYNEVSFVGDVSSSLATATARPISASRSTRRKSRSRQSALSWPALRQRNPEGTIGVIQKKWKVDAEIAKGSYQAIIKALNDDGIIGEKQLKVHFDLIRRMEKIIGEIPVDKVGDFLLLREVRKESAGKSSRNSCDLTGQAVLATGCS